MKKLLLLILIVVLSCITYTAYADPIYFNGVPIKSDCSDIKFGTCLDSDDGKLYVWDGSAVVLVTVAIGPITREMVIVEKTTNANLSILECSDTIITNRGWTGGADMTLILPDADTIVGAGLKLKFLNVVTDAAEDVYIDTEGTTTKIYLDGLPGTDGHRIWLDNPTIGESITCHTVTIDGTTYDWFCDSINGIWADKGS